jgi:hypothetical protein
MVGASKHQGRLFKGKEYIQVLLLLHCNIDCSLGFTPLNCAPVPVRQHPSAGRVKRR